MRPWFFALLGASLLPAQTPSMAGLDRARLDVSRLEELVREGAVARNRLTEARKHLDDAADDAILKRTLFGHITAQDLNRAQIDEMLAAARRRLERIDARLAGTRRLVDLGVAARAEIEPIESERELRRQTLQLAASRAETFEDVLALMKAEEEAIRRAGEARDKAAAWKPVERFEGRGKFDASMLRGIEQAYEKRFQSQMPISALGMTELHRSLGFDHTNRVDIKLSPVSAEGVWLRRFLEQAGIPYFAFRTFIPGSATGAHIHIGPPSLRLPVATPKS